MTRRPARLDLKWAQLAWLGAVMIGLGVGHMALARGTHQLHIIHVSLGAPIWSPW